MPIPNLKMESIDPHKSIYTDTLPRIYGAPLQQKLIYMVLVHWLVVHLSHIAFVFFNWTVPISLILFSYFSTGQVLTFSHSHISAHFYISSWTFYHYWSLPQHFVELYLIFHTSTALCRTFTHFSIFHITLWSFCWLPKCWVR